MHLDSSTVFHLAGILASIGALLYAVSDVHLLGHEVGAREPVLKRLRLCSGPTLSGLFRLAIWSTSALCPRRGWPGAVFWAC